MIVRAFISYIYLAGVVLGFIIGLFLAMCSLYLLVLSVAALLAKEEPENRRRSETPRAQIAVVVPAHDEAHYIGRCVRSLQAQTYPKDLYEIVVIADNCADDTARIAASAGARVLVRDDPDRKGKGFALRWATDRLLGADCAPDAIAVVDADSVAHPEFLRRLTAPLQTGAEAVQGESLLSEEGSGKAALSATAFLLINRMRPLGLAVLHMPCNLAGNGMLLSASLLRSHPWNAFTSAEDLEYSIRLRLAGVRPAFARGALLYSPAVTQGPAAEQQRLRWVGGKLHVARRTIPVLVARGLFRCRPSLLETALDLAVPPLALLAAGAGMATVVGAPLTATGIMPAWAWAPSLVAAAALPLSVLIGLRAADAPRWAYRSMARAPAFVCARALTAHRILRFRAHSWVRAQRPGDAVSRAADL
jgi:cellulose synthase/poly-beta-1,6-N-acetylglucosamine synthase-like glycosyltransferase